MEKEIYPNKFLLRRFGKIDENGELTVRVRQNGDNYKLQIKKPVVYDEALHIKEEYERDIKDLPDKILGEQLKDILGMDFPDFYMLGKLETQRKVFYPNRDVEISLDMSTYLVRWITRLKLNLVKKCRVSCFYYSLITELNRKKRLMESLQDL